MRSEKTMWGLYNYNALWGVFRTRRECIEHFKKVVGPRCDWRKEQRKGVVSAVKVTVTPHE